jgi:hypothetical protein
MKLTNEQKQELATVLAGKPILAELADVAVEESVRIAPVIEKWFEKYEQALENAESFISGFEDSADQEGVAELLTAIRELIPVEKWHG